MSRTEPVVIGIDVGTQGARVVAHAASGVLVGSESERFGGDWAGGEQDPADWWRAVVAGLRRLTATVHVPLPCETSQAVMRMRATSTTCRIVVSNDRAYASTSLRCCSC